MLNVHVMAHLANAPLPLLFDGAGYAGVPFSVPQKGMERREAPGVQRSQHPFGGD